MSHVAAQPGAQGAYVASPYGIRSGKLAMWLFILSDAVTFAAMLFACGYLRLASPDWVRPFAFHPVIVGGIIMTVVLLASALTMASAVAASASGNRAAALRWIVVTVLLGLAFTVANLHEWRNMLAEGWRPGVNPTGGSTLVGATFFAITGLSILHVVAGIVAIGVIAMKYRAGRIGAGAVETVGLYWQFVNVAWMFVFPLVYVMNLRSGLPASALPLLLVLASLGAASALLYLMRLRHERPILLWSVVLTLLFTLLMMNHIWADALRLARLRLPGS
ncbi:MAG TPA: cytochrome c oxidase subunit 3 [Gemmatimonadales bacterium]|jgi:cytochrome c oxidase subunit 3